jgi:hypothetical protein
VSGLADIKLCGMWLCDRASKPIAIEQSQCHDARFYFADSWYRNEFQDDGGDRQTLMLRSLHNKAVPDNFSSIVLNEVLNRKYNCENSWRHTFSVVRSLQLSASTIMGLWQGDDLQYLVRKIDPAINIVRDLKGKVSTIEISGERISVKQFRKHGKIVSSNKIVWDDGTTWIRPDYLTENPMLSYARSYELYPSRPDENRAGITSKTIPFLGEWKTGRRHSSILEGDYDEVMLVNENNEISKASIHGSIIEAIDWKLQGVLSPDNQTITWDNGALWVKSSVSDLDGVWLYNGRQVAIDFVSRQAVVFVNENGANANGIVDGLNLSIPVWNLVGVVSSNRRKIIFSNGSIWTR